MPLRLSITAKPGNNISFIAIRDGTIIVAVRERATAGRANAAIQRAIAAWLDIAPGAVSIARGASGRRKIVDVAGVDPDFLAGRIADLAER